LTAFVLCPAALLRTARPMSAIVPADHHAFRSRSSRRTHCFSSSEARLMCTFSRRERKCLYTTLSATDRAYGTSGSGGNCSGDSAVRRWMTRVAERLWRTYDGVDLTGALIERDLCEAMHMVWWKTDRRPVYISDPANERCASYVLMIGPSSLSSPSPTISSNPRKSSSQPVSSAERLPGL
jgi:hypothetical protein